MRDYQDDVEPFDDEQASRLARRPTGSGTEASAGTGGEPRGRGEEHDRGYGGKSGEPGRPDDFPRSRR